MANFDKSKFKGEILKETESDFNDIINKRKKRPPIHVDNDADLALEELVTADDRGDRNE
jgi:hypothetical protein